MAPRDRLVTKGDFSEPFSTPTFGPASSHGQFPQFAPRETFENWINTQSDSFQSTRTPLDFLKNFASGKGISIKDETGSFSMAPGGAFDLNSSKGWSVTGNPLAKSLGVSLPVNVGGNRGTIGFEAGADPQNPYGKINFAFGKAVQKFDPPPEEDSQPTPRINLYSQEPERKFANQSVKELLDRTLNSERDLYNPSTW